MSQVTIVVAIYIIGIVLGAFFLDIWGGDTNIKKGLIGLGWTALFIVGIFYADKEKDN